MTDEVFVMIERGTDGKPDLPKPPADMAGQLAWLKAMTAEQERLKNIEQQFKKQFKVTGNTPETTAIIKEFMPPKDRLFPVSIIEDIPRPRALLNPKEYTEQELEQHHKDVKQIFPDIKIQVVTLTTGEKGIAYIGTDTATMVAAVELVEKERAVKEAIEQQSEKFNGILKNRNNKGGYAEVPTAVKPINLPPRPKSERIKG